MANSILFEKYKRECKKRKISIPKLCMLAGVSTGKVYNWKYNGDPDWFNDLVRMDAVLNKVKVVEDDE